MSKETELLNKFIEKFSKNCGIGSTGFLPGNNCASKRSEKSLKSSSESSSGNPVVEWKGKAQDPPLVTQEIEPHKDSVIRGQAPSQQDSVVLHVDPLTYVGFKERMFIKSLLNK